MLRVGFGRVDITPELGMLMAGMCGRPRGTGIVWPLHARVLVADDGERRVAIVSLDLMALPATEVAMLQARLAADGGLDPETILVACSHTHRAPFTFTAGDADDNAVFGYLDAVYPKLAEAMSAAVAELRPAALVAAKTTAPGWVFNRRTVYAGDQVGTHGPARGDGFVGMESDPDDDVPVLLARGADGEVLGGLVGFACHPTVMASTPVYSADYPGAFVEEMEARHGGTFGFLLGATADAGPEDPAADDEADALGADHGAAMGRALAERADAALAAGRAVAADRVDFATTRLRIAQRRPTPKEVELARWYLEEAPADLDEAAFMLRFYGHPFTFNDGHQLSNERFVRDLLGMWEWQRRVGTRELIEEVEIQVVLLGDVAVVAYPVELFADFGRRLKGHSPFRDTIVATLANGWHGYAPTPEAFARGGYEPRFGYASRLVPEAGDLMTDAALGLLREVASSTRRGAR